MGFLNLSTAQDICTHGLGALQSSQVKVFIEDIPICLFADFAWEDDLCPEVGGTHCHPDALTCSLKVFVQDRGVHRFGDERLCGATTITKLGGSIAKVWVS